MKQYEMIEHVLERIDVKGHATPDQVAEDLGISYEEALTLILEMRDRKLIESWYDEELNEEIPLRQVRYSGYKGWDYEEVFELLGLEVPEYPFDDGRDPFIPEVAYKITGTFSLGAFTFGEPTEEDKARIKVMRDWLRALIAESICSDYHTPLLFGILMIEDDGEFVKAFAQNVGFMWN